MYRLCTLPRHPTALVLGFAIAALAAGEARAQCATPASSSDFEAVLGEAEAALSKLDVAAFKALVEGADTLLPCVDEPIAPRLAANYQRVWGIRAFGERDPIAPRAFAAARWIEPEYQFSKSLLPEGNPIRTEYENVRYTERATEPFDRPESGAIHVDGTPAAERPISWPAVVQWIDGDEKVRFTDYLLPGEKLPEYPTWVAPEVPDKKPPVGLIVATATTAVASGALYGVATFQESRYKDTVNNPVPDPKLDDLRRSTNSLVVASAVTATAALGMGVAVVIAW